MLRQASLDEEVRRSHPKGCDRVHIYITTHDSEYGVNSLDELPKAWLDALIRELNSSRWSDGTLPVMPTVLANLKASSISGLELMLAIHGI